MNRQPYIYTMPEGFLHDSSIGVKWKIYAIVNGFWVSGKTCYAANKFFAEKLGVSERQIRNGFEQLEKDGYLERVIKGNSRIALPKGTIVEEEVSLPRGGSESSAEAEARVPHISDSISDNNTSEATASQEITSVSEEDSSRAKSKPKYPHAKVVFCWFKGRELSWNINTTELKHAELLWERGEKAVKGILLFLERQAEDPFCPQVTKPSDLERKWKDIQAYAKKNDL